MSVVIIIIMIIQARAPEALGVAVLTTNRAPSSFTRHLERKMSCPTIVQVTNISPQANKQQMNELFSYLGDISDLKLFPEE